MRAHRITLSAVSALLLAGCPQPDASVDTDAPDDMVGTCTEATANTVPAVLTGTTVEQGDDVSGSCSFGDSPDSLVRFEAPQSGTYTVSTAGSSFDTVLVVLDSCEAMAETACDDDWSFGLTSELVLTLEDGQSVLLAVDGYDDAEQGEWQLSIDLAHTAEQSCADQVDNDADGLTDCSDNDCAESADCIEVCGDGFDNNTDGFTDCADPQCSNTPGCQEVCHDAIDNDADGLADCLDNDCTGTPPCTEACTGGTDEDLDGDVDCLDTDCTDTPICEASCTQQTLTERGVVTGTTLGLPDSKQPGTCGSEASGSDYAVAFIAPDDAVYTVTTDGSAFDTVLYALDSDCTGSEQACDDDAGSADASRMSLFLTAGQTAVFVVDGYGRQDAGDFTLTIQ